MRTVSFVAALFLVGCDKIPSFGGGDDGGEGKVIEAPVEPLDLFVTDATISMITVKNGETEVPAKFEGVGGKLTFDNGDTRQGLAGALTIDLGSWDSGLGVRDERVQTLFFNIDKNPTATFSLDALDGMPEEGIAVGHDAQLTAKGTVYLAGGNAAVEAPVKLSRTGDLEYHLDTTEPFEISIEGLGLMAPLKELMRVCEHKSIDDTVKVSARMSLGPVEPEQDEPETKPDTDEESKEPNSEVMRRRLETVRAKRKVRRGKGGKSKR